MLITHEMWHELVSRVRDLEVRQDHVEIVTLLKTIDHKVDALGAESQKAIDALAADVRGKTTALSKVVSDQSRK